MAKQTSFQVFKKHWKNFWNFIWNDDSLLSWVANIILAFILIKFVVYPLLSLILHTGFPIVAVISGSMTHDGSYNDWWASPAICTDIENECSQKEFYSLFNITKENFNSFNFKNGFNKGDIIFLYGDKDIDIGEVIVFAVPGRSDPIIHRIIMTHEDEGITYYTTKGDHNPAIITFEQYTHQDNVLGVAKFRIPYIGYVKIWFFQAVMFIKSVF